jgi:hypothetical protein
MPSLQPQPQPQSQPRLPPQPRQHRAAPAACGYFYVSLVPGEKQPLGPMDAVRFAQGTACNVALSSEAPTDIVVYPDAYGDAATARQGAASRLATEHPSHAVAISAPPPVPFEVAVTALAQDASVFGLQVNNEHPIPAHQVFSTDRAGHLTAHLVLSLYPASLLRLLLLSTTGRDGDGTALCAGGALHSRRGAEQCGAGYVTVATLTVREIV